VENDLTRLETEQAANQEKLIELSQKNLSVQELLKTIASKQKEIDRIYSQFEQLEEEKKNF
jgi:hypothetical protein